MLQIVNISDFAQQPGVVCVGDDFVLVENISNLPFVSQPFKTVLLLAFFCIKGQARIVLDCDNGGAVSLKVGDVFVSRPNQPLYQTLLSNDCCICVLGYTPRVVDHLITTKQDTWDMLNLAFGNSVLHYGEKYMTEHLLMIIDMLRQRATNLHLRFREQQSVHLFASLLFEIINQSICHQEADSGFAISRLGRTDSIFRDFINCLTASEGRQRTVSYFADMLCVSPKHLSKIIKEKTGRKAIDVITDHAIEQIKLDLKLTDASISQLADKYNFTNFSFFCQFVKKHLGKTPQEVRAR